MDNLSGSLLLVQQLILKLCWKQLDLIVLGLCRCTVSTDPCAERASVLMADVLVIAMVETSRQIFGVFYRTKSQEQKQGQHCFLMYFTVIFFSCCCFIISSNMTNWKKDYDASYKDGKLL